jgi:regulatory protein
MLKYPAMQKRRRRKPAAESESQPATPLTPEQIRRRTFQHAVKLLAAKSRSIAELRERLLERPQTNEATVEAVIARLCEYGYLDDQRYAVGYASLKVRQRPLGRARLARDLQFKQVSSEVAEQALDQVFQETSEADLLDRAVAKRLRLRGQPKTRAEAKSLFDHLLRLGFPYELVAGKVRAALQIIVDDDDGSL